MYWNGCLDGLGHSIFGINRNKMKWAVGTVCAPHSWSALKGSSFMGCASTERSIGIMQTLSHWAKQSSEFSKPGYFKSLAMTNSRWNPPNALLPSCCGGMGFSAPWGFSILRLSQEPSRVGVYTVQKFQSVTAPSQPLLIASPTHHCRVTPEAQEALKASVEIYSY